MNRKILAYLKNNPNSRLQDISNHLGITTVECKKALSYLIHGKYILRKTRLSKNNDGKTSKFLAYQLSPKGNRVLTIQLKKDDKNLMGQHESEDTKKIFLSHAYLDRKIADRIINKLILPNFTLDKKDIFYTSNREMGISVSLNWRNKIKTQIKECKIYLALITTNFQESEMCLNELGAAWALDKTIYPLILPPVNYNNFSLLISDLQALDISKAVNIKSLLNSLQIDLIKIYKLGLRSDANMDDDIAKFGKSLRQFLRKNPALFKPSEAIDREKPKRADYINHIPGRDAILKQSKIEWPNDSAMQEHYINSQMDAIRLLIKLKTQYKNQKLVDIYISDAEKRYPNDFVTQLYAVRQQLDREKLVI